MATKKGPAATNKQLGEALGLSHSTISRMRTGQRTGSTITLQRLADLTETPVEKVIKAASAARGDNTRAWLAIMKKADSAVAAS